MTCWIYESFYVGAIIYVRWGHDAAAEAALRASAGVLSLLLQAVTCLRAEAGIYMEAAIHASEAGMYMEAAIHMLST